MTTTNTNTAPLTKPTNSDRFVRVKASALRVGMVDSQGWKIDEVEHLVGRLTCVWTAENGDHYTYGAYRVRLVHRVTRKAHVSYFHPANYVGPFEVSSLSGPALAA